RPVDFLPLSRRHGSKYPAISPIVEIRRYREEWDVARNQYNLHEHRRLGAERRAYRRRTVEGELIGNCEPSEGWTVVPEFCGEDLPTETPARRLGRRCLDPGHYVNRHPAGILEITR